MSQMKVLVSEGTLSWAYVSPVPVPACYYFILQPKLSVRCRFHALNLQDTLNIAPLFLIPTVGFDQTKTMRNSRHPRVLA